MVIVVKGVFFQVFLFPDRVEQLMQAPVISQHPFAVAAVVERLGRELVFRFGMVTLDEFAAHVIVVA